MKIFRLIVFLLLVGWGTEGVVAEEFNCEQDSKRIDVSLCPTYSNYANSPSSNATDFFNKTVLARAFKNSPANPIGNESVIIKIPAVTFYFKTDEDTKTVDYIHLDGRFNKDTSRWCADCKMHKNYIT